jgi:hypothetical protein
VRLTVDGVSQTESFEMTINPNESYTRAETDAKADFWMALYDKAEEGVQAVLEAKAAQATVEEAVATEGASDELRAQGEVIDKLASDFVGSMVSTGTTLVQIISQPTKPLSKFVTLHNIMETSEGPPNEPMLEVYERTAAEIDAAIAAFQTDLAREMARFEELGGA